MKKAEWEKRETERRQLSLNEKNLVEDLRNRTESVAELEKELKVSKKAREDLDKMLRDKMREFRELSEKYDDQMTTIATLEKRLEMKESFFKEEVRKYGERQAELEN
jgi:chromosome segregation ATPase